MISNARNRWWPGRAGLAWDERQRVSYPQAAKAVSDLGRHLKALEKDRVACVGITPANDLSHVAVLLALMKRGINLYVGSPHTGPGRPMPGFCEKILTLNGPGTPLGEVAQCLDVAANPAYTGAGNGLAANSGAVLFSSSGTTGAPKFIRYQARKLWQNAAQCVRRFGIRPGHRVLVPVPVSHMYGLGVGLLPALLAGASVCLVEKNNVIKLYDKLSTFGPDFTLLTPAVCRMLLLLGKRPPGRGTYIVAGDKLQRETFADFESRYGKLLNLYGCTEMGAIGTSDPEAGLAERAEGVVKPFDGVHCTVDGPEKGEIACRHVAGFEQYVDDAGRSLGGTESWYKTRDLGVVAEPGRFRVVGRMDNCVNRNGFLVALQEVESALENLFTEFSQVVVIPGNDETVMGKSLIAIGELKSAALLSGETARRRSREKMPSHLVPDVFHFLPHLPTLGNGKPDRNVLIKTYGTATTTH